MSAQLSNFALTLESSEQETLSEMYTAFGNRPFLQHQAKAFEQSPLVNAYRKVEVKFLMNVKTVPRSSVPKSANIIGSHTIYKLKLNDDQSLKLKAHIAPHGMQHVPPNWNSCHLLNCYCSKMALGSC